MSKVIRVDPKAVKITVGGQPLGDLWDIEEQAGSTDGRSSCGEIVSVLTIEYGDRVRWKPHSPVRTVIHVAWVLGAIAVTTDDNLRWYFEVSGDGWPTVERVTEETRPG